MFLSLSFNVWPIYFIFFLPTFSKIIGIVFYFINILVDFH